MEVTRTLPHTRSETVLMRATAWFGSQLDPINCSRLGESETNVPGGGQCAPIITRSVDAQSTTKPAEAAQIRSDVVAGWRGAFFSYEQHLSTTETDFGLPLKCPTIHTDS